MRCWWISLAFAVLYPVGGVKVFHILGVEKGMQRRLLPVNEPVIFKVDNKCKRLSQANTTGCRCGGCHAYPQQPAQSVETVFQSLYAYPHAVVTVSGHYPTSA